VGHPDQWHGNSNIHATSFDDGRHKKFALDEKAAALYRQCTDLSCSLEGSSARAQGAAAPQVP